jgi:hypothetical protein
MESDLLKDLAPEIKHKLLEARKAVEKDELEEDDDVMEAIAEAVEAALDDDETPATRERGGKREGKTPVIAEASPTPENKGDATSPNAGLHETLDEAAIDKMDEAGAKAALKNLNKQYGSKVAEAKRSAQALSSSERRLSESRIDALLEDENIPESFRPRLRREMLTEGLANRREMLAFVHEFAQAYIAPHVREGTGGSRVRESAGSGVKVPDFTKAQ